MSKPESIAKTLSNVSDIDILNNPDIAHIFINQNKVIKTNSIPGLKIETAEVEDRIEVKVIIEAGVKIEHPVHMCFGMMSREGVQKIVMDIQAKQDSKVDVLAHCAFPNAENIKHIMEAEICLEKNASYSYFERHIHGDSGGVEVIPKANIQLQEKARFYTEFELLQGRAGTIDINYETDCAKDSVLEMVTRINAIKDDVVKIKEVGNLHGDHARGFLNSRVAARDNSKAEVYNKLTASGSYARGHVDCKEIIKDEALVSAIPIVEVSNPKAHITHEASLGSVDSKQLQTLMSRGLDEEKATDLIIQGLLS